MEANKILCWFFGHKDCLKGKTGHFIFVCERCGEVRKLNPWFNPRIQSEERRH